MQPLLSRHNSASHQRTPRKSSSFLSLRREKSSAPASSAPPSAFDSPTSYFDAYPSAPYSFPSLDSPPPPPKKPYSSSSSRPHPSSSSSRSNAQPDVPQLRFSNSSSTQHTETPPRTPDDFSSSSDSLDNFPVIVAAPIAGVETMDALVDGMNGADIGPRSSASRSRFAIPGHHPLYQPPLPTPPPGVVLGGGKARRVVRNEHHSGDSSDDDSYPSITPSSRTRKRRVRPHSSRSASASTVTQPSKPSISVDPPVVPQEPEFTRKLIPRTSAATISSYSENRKSLVPSISEIIRNHAPLESQVRSRPSAFRSSSLYTTSNHGHSTVQEEAESEPEPIARGEEADILSRSSIDSVADEVQRTIRNQAAVPKPRPPRSNPPPSSASAFIRRHSTISADNASLYSPRSDPGAPSVYSLSAPSSFIPVSPLDANFLAKPNPSLAVAQYLRSSRLTTLLRLTRSPHASQDNPLTVSLSDLGSPNGYPVLVFLGLGCVRHIMGLYDEMAECLGLRLITIDRWGLGRTEPRSKSAKGIMQWASVVEEVLDLLRIDQCSIMAHSAGAPYALSFANKLPSRIRGDVCLLAPWVGGSESSGYKWLKYVPNTILKTAQAAEWKVQAWMIGKPPTIAYEGIGYTAPVASKTTNESQEVLPRFSDSLSVSNPSMDGKPRPSMASSTFSEYDDLRDFDGRFESKSTLALSRPSTHGQEGGSGYAKRKTSRGFLDRLKGSSSNTNPPIPPTPQEKPMTTGKRLKSLRSMSSLKSKKSQQQVRRSEPSSPQLPPSLRIDVGLGLEEISWPKNEDLDSISLNMSSNQTTPRMFSTTGSVGSGSTPRSNGRRSISFTSTKTPVSMPASPSPSTFTTSQNAPYDHSHHVAIGNALIAASHAESSKGTTNDLLQILNHEGHSWGFSYSSYPHKVRVWYGDKDERIAENAVRWMEQTMGPDRCSVKVVKGADHGLMYRSSAVVDVLEWILSAWRTEERRPFSDLLR